MNKILLNFVKFLGSTLNVLLNPFYSLMSITQKKKEHDENDNKFSVKLSKFFKSSYMILLLSAIITIMIIFLIYHKEILGV